MTRKEISLKMKDMSYTESVALLRDEYGSVPYRYRTPGNSRLKEGLVVHHVSESFIPNLSMSKSEFKKFIAFTTEVSDAQLKVDVKNVEMLMGYYELYQEPEYLVYCSIPQHRALHIKLRKEYPEMKRFTKLTKMWRMHKQEKE